MNPVKYEAIKLTLGVLATVGLYTVLYRENKFYRFWEHVFLGLAAGWASVTLWTETLKENWWDAMLGKTAEQGVSTGEPGYWIYAIMLPLGILGYFVYSKKHSWIAKIPIGIILGLWSGQQIQIWWQTYGPQMKASMLPIVPTTWESMTRPAMNGLTPEQMASVTANIYPSQAIGNLLAIITVVCVLTYFLFSFELKNKVVSGMSKTGRYLLMIGFGAIFGSTVMMRFSLLIDRMYFITIEWFDALKLLGG